MSYRIEENAHGKIEGHDGRMLFRASLDLLLIRKSWEAGIDLEDLADGFGPGLGTMGGDWSGIRDSSPEATRKMLGRSLDWIDSCVEARKLHI